MEWTEETISRLRSLWQEGLSTAEIGRRLAVTKNAVVGKAHRLTLPPRPSPIRKASGENAGAPRPRRDPARTLKLVSKPPGARAPAAMPEPLPPEAAAGQPDTPVAALRAIRPLQPPAAQIAPDLELAASRSSQPVQRRRGQTCCWPLGEPGTKQFRFCGGEPMPGKPYCCEHAQLAYVKLRDRRDTVA